MSLLNDALKAAEQRQNHAAAPSAYVGQPRSSSAGRKQGWALLAVASVAVVVGAGGYLYWPSGSPESSPAGTGLALEANRPEVRQTGETATPSVTPAQPVEDNISPVAASGVPEDEAADEDETVNESTGTDGLRPVTDVDVVAIDGPGGAAAGSRTGETAEKSVAEAEPEKPEVASDNSSGWQSSAFTGSGPKAVPAREQTDEKPAEHERDPSTDKPEVSVRTAETRAGTDSDNDIKRSRQSPEQVDRETSRQLERLLKQGAAVEAESALARITESQPAPRSRTVFARAMLVKDQAGKALAWAPADVANNNPGLRLIRARALLADGSLDDAVATLKRQVPSVEGNIEYWVTLATLLQQQGQNGEAATYWAELIAWDDSQPAWWVGLAIALEGRGDAPAARKAYEQAAVLPGLAPSLADYVRQRLQILRAG